MHPKIICHMVASIDGHLLVDPRAPPPAGTDFDIVHQTYEQVASRFNADGWIVGRKTMGDFAEGAFWTPHTVLGTFAEPMLRIARGETSP